jgi:hypothetical protein
VPSTLGRYPESNTGSICADAVRHSAPPELWEPGPTHGAYESAALARIVSWASPEDCAALTRLVPKARRDSVRGRQDRRPREVGGAARPSQLRRRPAHLA